MNEGLKTTLEVLGSTHNEAAVRVLVPALDSPRAAIREGALAAVLSRRNPAGHREVLRRLRTADERSKAIILEHRGRMTQALRDAVLGSDFELCASGCEAAVWFREFDLIPALITVLEDTSSPHDELAGQTLSRLVELLYGELAGAGPNDGRRDPQMVRRHVIAALELSMGRFPSHKRREIVGAYLLLVHRDSNVLKQVLNDPHHAAFLVLVDVLSKSPSPGVIGLLLAFLDDPRASSAALSVVSKRSDLTFVRYFLRKIGNEPSAAVKQNLRRIESVAWLADGTEILDQLDGAAQHAAVRLVMASNIPRDDAFCLVRHLLLHGKPMGRRAAAEALSQFHGSESNDLALQALDDEDPQVQANALVQLRGRGIPGVLPRLVEKIDSPHAVVRNAARTSLDEFSFQRFLAAFDMLDDEVRVSTGTLVKKVDLKTIPLLKAEMESRVRTRRLRALAIARTIGAVEPLEATILGLLRDEDHMVRAEAAKALGRAESPGSWEALEKALHDRSATVQEAARESMAERAQSPQRPATLYDGRG
ncbi:MAG: hypothetical protein A2V98_04530 [Planctomycetes bacterium RBG_16_64_12]|nr:MAG: hypothetical protein A2V98_04530 [Planctomycetes bacterium RBG_16_64_12]